MTRWKFKRKKLLRRISKKIGVNHRILGASFNSKYPIIISTLCDLVELLSDSAKTSQDMFNPVGIGHITRLLTQAVRCGFNKRAMSKPYH